MEDRRRGAAAQARLQGFSRRRRRPDRQIVKEGASFRLLSLAGVFTAIGPANRPSRSRPMTPSSSAAAGMGWAPRIISPKSTGSQHRRHRARLARRRQTGRNTTIIRSNYLWEASEAMYGHAHKVWPGRRTQLQRDVQPARGAHAGAHPPRGTFRRHALRQPARTGRGEGSGPILIPHIRYPCAARRCSDRGGVPATTRSPGAMRDAGAAGVDIIELRGQGDPPRRRGRGDRRSRPRRGDDRDAQDRRRRSG